MVKNKSKIRIISLFFLVAILISTLSFNTVALQTIINVADGTVGDWRGVSRFNDSFGDANGVGPNDLTRLFVTNDATSIYVRWDVILSGNKTTISSAAYSLAINSQNSGGSTRPAVEVRAYVGFNSQGAVSEVCLESATKKISLPLTYAEQISTGTTLSTVSVEAKFPFSDFNNNTMTVSPITSASLFPLWGEALASASFKSAVKDYIPDGGYLKYDAATSTSTPIGTGPVAGVTTLATNPYVVAGANVYYYATIKNVGDGTTNLAFTTLKWQLPAGFTYVAGSTTGLTTSNPTISSGLLTWTVSGSLAAGASTTLYFTAVASSTADIYYSDVDLIATMPNVTYDNGATAPVTVGATYVPITLTASSTTQNTANLSWTTFSGASKYSVYDNGVLIASGLTGTTYQVNGLTAGSAHSFYIEAFNSVNDYMDASNTASVTTVGPYNVTVQNLLTNDNTPTITGTTNAPNGSNTVRITVNGQNYTGSVSNGSWSADVTNVLADNTYSVSAVITSGASNTGNGTLTVDTVAPTISVNSLNTKNRTPTISGTSNASDGRTVTITVNGQLYTGVVASGAWNIPVTATLADKTYTVSASVSDPAGNVGTNTGTLIVDNVAPTITVNNLTTNNRTPTITGTTDAPNGSTVTLTIDSKQYTGSVSGGAWSILVTQALADNNYTASASVSDIAGNVGTNTGTVLIDNVAPVITVNSLNTKNRMPTVTGTTDVPDGRTVTLTIDGHQYTGLVSGGVWSIAVTNSLADNTYTASASVSDIAGNIGSGTGPVIVDNVAPTISVNSLNTKNRTPTITGTTTAPDGRTVTLTINNQQYTSLVSGGAWSIPVTNSLSDNTYPASASVSDIAGNIGTGEGTVIIDNVPPTVIVNSLTTKERTPIVTGTSNAPNGSAVTLTINGIQYTGEVQNGNWSIHIANYLADNIYTANVSITDPAGNVGTGSGTVVIDNEPPVITVNSLTTKDRTPTVTGTTNAVDGSTVTLTINGHDYTTQALNGGWSVDVTRTLADNTTYTASASVYDVAGNEGTATGTVIIDNIAPVITVNSLTTNHPTPTLTGSTDASDGSVVTLTVNDVQYTGEVIDGSWSVVVNTPLADGVYAVSASVSDAAGNTGTNTGSLTVDTYVKSSDANLISIVPSSGTLSPQFSSQITSYNVDVVYAVNSISLTSVVSDKEATIKVNGVAVSSGSPSGSIPLSVGPNVITVEVTAENGVAIKTYTITVTRAKDASLTEFALDTSDIANKNITLYGTDLDSLYLYQIWCYQYVIDEFNVNEGPSWILAKAYNVSMAIDELGNSSYTFKYDGSPFDRCKIFVRIKDLNGNTSTYVNEYSVATNTKVKINNVKIDNVIAVETFYKTAGTDVNFNVDVTPAQGSSGQITYSYYLNKFPISSLTDILTPSVKWTIPFTFHPGKYELKVRAYQDGEFDEKIVNFFIKNNNSTTPELVDNCITIPSIIAGENPVIAMLENDLAPNEPQRKYTFSFSEPSRSAFYTSSQKQTNYTFLYPGFYQFVALINYEASSISYTDGAIRITQISRNTQQQKKPVVKLDETILALNGDIIPYSQATNIVNPGDTLVFNASALNPDNTSLYEYSFFRLDAKGYRLVKDYDNALNGNNGNILIWKPESPGVYSIQVRARLKEFADSASNKRQVSYEDAKTYTFIVQGAQQKVENVVIALSGQYLSKNPIQITATCTDANINTNNLLYRFESYDKDMKTITLADYSPLNTCEWIPRKAGDYQIRVLVRDKNSYGYYDKFEQTDNIVIAKP